MHLINMNGESKTETTRRIRCVPSHPHEMYKCHLLQHTEICLVITRSAKYLNNELDLLREREKKKRIYLSLRRLSSAA